MAQLIIISGYTSAGKTTAAKIMMGLNGNLIGTGNIIREMFKKENTLLNGDLLQRFNSELKAKLGRNYISIIEPFIKNDKVNIIDSARTYDDILYLQDKHNVITIAITANEDVRFSRFVERKRETDIINKRYFEEQTQREIEWGINELVENSMYKIENNKNLIDYENKIKLIIERVNISEQC
jgi:dephospho-CoA kinase